MVAIKKGYEGSQSLIGPGGLGGGLRCQRPSWQVTCEAWRRISQGTSPPGCLTQAKTETPCLGGCEVVGTRVCLHFQS